MARGFFSLARRLSVCAIVCSVAAACGSAPQEAPPTTTRADPLDDITNTRRIADVYLNGDRIDRGALRAAWATSDP